MSVKISSLELENVKRVRAVALEPTEKGLTVIGGRNGQGKTSVLDAIAWTLGGEKYRPSQPGREGSVLPPSIKVTLNNGIVVERKGKNSALKVTDPSGSKRGQKLLDDFVEQLALNLPKFMEASNKEKAETLLNIIGVGPELARLDQEARQIYQERLALGRIEDQKKKYAAELPEYDGVPEEMVNASDLIRAMQEMMARNNQRQQWAREYDAIMAERLRVEQEVEQAGGRLRELQKQASELEKKSIAAQKSPREMEMEDTSALEAQIGEVDEINAKVRANLERQKAAEEARELTKQYNVMSVKLDEVRGRRRALLEGAELPLPGLSVEDDALCYKGKAWDCMSGAEQLMVATAIVRKLKPECGFVLVDKLEQMDSETLRDFGTWLEGEGLQVIATRVSSSGEDCTVVIEDGTVKELGTRKTDAPHEVPSDEVKNAPEMKFTMGVF